MQLQPLTVGQRVRIYRDPYERRGLEGEAQLVKFSRPLPAVGLGGKLLEMPAFPRLRAGTWWVRMLDGQANAPVLRLVLPELV